MLKSKELDLELIKEGFEMFDVENKGIINSSELKEALEDMNLKEKNLFMFELFSSLCSNQEIKSKGGITLDEFINFFIEKVSDVESRKGIKDIFNTFSDVDDKIQMPTFYQTAKELGDEDNYVEIKRLVEMSKTGGKELNFEEFYNIMKDNDEKKKKNYYYQNYTYQGHLNNNNNKTNQNNRYSSNLGENIGHNEFKRYHRKYRGQKSNDFTNKSDNINKNLVYIQFKK